MMVGDFRQICTITKNELIKSVRGKKFLVSLLIVLLVFGLITLLGYATNGWDPQFTTANIISTYMSYIGMVALLIVALMSSVALVSEFEERTALILFTRPVRRTSIFIGKIFSCLIIEALIILVYYAIVTAFSLYHVGEVSDKMLTSYVMCVLYAFAASGIAFVISAFFKKSSVCTIISLLVLILVIPVITGMLKGDTWFMLDTAGNSIITCVPEYVKAYNETVDMFTAVVSNAADVLKGFASPDMQELAKALNEVILSGGLSTLDPNVIAMIVAMDQFFLSIPVDNITDMADVLNMMVGSDMMKKIDNPNVLLEGSVLIIWGIAGYLIAWCKFVRREF